MHPDLAAGIINSSLVILFKIFVLEKTMLDLIELLSTQTNLLASEGGWFVQNWDNLVAAFTEKRYFDVMLNPYLIIGSVLIFMTGIFTKNTRFLMIVIAMWGYSSVYHFTIADKGEGDVMFDYTSMQVSEVGPMVWFFLGFVSVTGILLYLGFVKNND